MDDRTTEFVEKDPAEIRDEMRHTRAAITEKIGALEDRVTQRVEDIQHRVETTVEKVHDSIHDTVQTVRQTVDWRHHMQEHPWAMFGGAVFAGFVGSRLLASSEARTLVRDSMSAASRSLMQTNPVADRRPGNGAAPTLVDRAMDQFNTQVGRLEQAALSAAGSFLERAITHAIPGLAGHLRGFKRD